MMKNIGIIFILGILLISFISADNNVYVNTNYHQKDIYNLTNVNSTNLYGKLQDINSSELEIQSDNKIGILDSFINLLIDNRVTQDFVRILGFYNTTEVDTEITNANSSVVNWVDDLFVRFTELFGYNYYNSTTLQNLTQLNNDLGIGNWTGDKPNYYTKEEVNTNISSANTSMKNYVDSGLNLKANLSGGNSFTGQQDFNGGWGSNGLSIINGDIYAQTGYFYNISSLQINTLEVNGSVVPDVNNTFDIGNNTLKWRDAYFSRNVNATNFYQSGNPVLDLSNQYWNRSSTNVFLANTGDNVGIGTTTPSEKLDVVDNNVLNYNSASIPLLSAPGQVIHNTNTADNSNYVGLQLAVDGSSGYSGYGFIGVARKSSYGDMVIGTRDSDGFLERMRITSAGNVGIGTTSPSSKLDVRSALSDTPGTGALALGELGGSGFYNFRLSTSTADLILDRYYSSWQSTPVLTVQRSTGNVGIGTTTPSSKLHIQESTGANIILNSNTGEVGNGVYMTEGNSAIPKTNGAYLYYNGSTNLFNIATGAGTLTDRFTIARDTGNVGIGRNPSEKLDVNGNIRLGFNNYIALLEVPSSGTGGYVQGTGESGTNAGYGAWLNYNAYWNGTNWLQPRGSLASYLYSSNVHLGWTWRYAPKGEVNGGNITPTQLMSLTNTGNLDVAGTINAVNLKINGTAIGTGTITGAGTYGYLPMLNGTTSINNSAIYQNGSNIGIGTTAPDVKLQVNDTLQVGGEGGGGIGNQTGIIYIGGSRAGPLWYTTSIRTINTDQSPATLKPRMGFFTQTTETYLAINQTERMSILSDSGNVGIGTTSPTQKLTIATDTSNDGITLTNSTGGVRGTIAQVSTTGGYLALYNNVSELTSLIRGYSISGVQAYFTAGNVGIGTTSPTSKLQVSKDVIANYLTTAQLLLTGSTNTNKTLSLGYDTTNDVGFIEAAISGTGYKPLLINPYGGNVGIGTTTPQNTLNVVGTINATGNITGNFIYGGIWNHNDSGSVLNITLSDTWYNLSGGVCNSYNGITCNNTTYNKLTIQIPGVYRIQYIGTGAGQNNHIYHAVVMVNGVKQNNTESHMLTAAGDVHSLSGLGYIHVLAGDVINAAVKDSTGTGDLTIYNTNLIMERVGN